MLGLGLDALPAEFRAELGEGNGKGVRSADGRGGRGQGVAGESDWSGQSAEDSEDDDNS